MNRLTRRLNKCGHTRVSEDNPYTADCTYKTLCGKLGAYEDTGLSPEEVEQMKHEYFDLVVEVDRLRKELEGTDELM